MRGCPDRPVCGGLWTHRTGLDGWMFSKCSHGERANERSAELVEGDKRGVGLEVGQDADDGLWEVLIESEEARHVRALSCCDGGAQVLCELSLQVEGVLDRDRLDVRVQPVDLRFSEPAVGQGAERL